MSHSKIATVDRVGSEVPRELAIPLALARLLGRVKFTETGCWEWTGHKNAIGYGEATFAGKRYMVHRFMYEALTNAPVPKGFDICHSCHNPSCVNPYHIRSDTHQANLLESSQAKRLNGQSKTHCKRGHPLDGDNLWVARAGFRQCRICSRARYRRRLGWPERLLYADVVIPHGYMLSRETGEIVSRKQCTTS